VNNSPNELPPDLSGWTLITRDGKVFAVSSRHGGSAAFPDEPGALDKVIASARDLKRWTEAVDPVTGERRN
jgi:hypothetical protein